MQTQPMASQMKEAPCEAQSASAAQVEGELSQTPQPGEAPGGTHSSISCGGQSVSARHCPEARPPVPPAPPAAVVEVVVSAPAPTPRLGRAPQAAVEAREKRKARIVQRFMAGMMRLSPPVGATDKGVSCPQ